MIYIIFALVLASTTSIKSQIVSDSVEYTHIYISDTSNEVRVYKESKDYVNPFSPISYFSINIPYRTYFSLCLCRIIDSNKVSLIKPIFYDYLDKGNYRIEDSDLNIASGIYFYQIDVLDSIYYQKVLFCKIAKYPFRVIGEIRG